MIMKKYVVLYNICSIISHCFLNNHRHWQCVFLFSLVLKKTDINIININPSTETVIY